MNEKQVLALYRSACGAAGRREDPYASEGWKKVLMRFSKEEVSAALEGWWNDTKPVQGVLLEKPRGSTMPTPADLKARIMAERQRLYEQSAAVRQRKQQIAEFWGWVAERGITEDEVREKWPSYVGTRPAERENAA